MAITVTPNLTNVSMCDTLTGWAGGISNLALDPSIKVEGTNSLCAWIDATTSAIEYFTISATNLSNGEHVYVWMLCSGVVDTKANGGYRIVLYTDASNYATFFAGGSDTHNNGWQLMVCDASGTPDLETGTFNPASVTRVGIQFKTLTAGFKKGQTFIQNCFWDAVRYGKGLTITSGATDKINFEDILNADTLAWGVITKTFGAYVVQGKLIFGSDSSGSVDFEDSNQVILFPSNDKVGDSFYGIQVLGNSGGTTNFVLGEKSGDSGISGCTFKSVDPTKTFTFDVSDTDDDVIKIYGSIFINAGTITLPTTAANKEVLNCNITTMDGVIISSCDIMNCNFIAADDEAAVMASTSHHLSDCNFIANPNAIRITNPGTYELDNISFSGNTVDIDNTSGGAVTINCINGSNPTTYTGSTTINNPVQLTIEIVDADGDLITENCEVTIVKIADTSELFHEDDITDGSTTYNYSSGGGTSTYITIMNVAGYQPKLVNNFVLPSSGSSVLTVQLDNDPFYNNP